MSFSLFSCSSLYLLCLLRILVVQSNEVSVGDFLYFDEFRGTPYTVSADERSWMLNDKRTLLLGGSIHYPRLAVYQWPDILQKMKDEGLNHAEIYTFWNLHEPTYDFSDKHVYNYEGRANLTHFLQIASDVGMFINVRIGPYVCALSITPYICM